MNLPRIKEDKANHFIYGTIITFLSLLVFNNIWISFGICLTIALFKELLDKYDSNPNSHFDLMDIVWTLIGSIWTILIYLK